MPDTIVQQTYRPYKTTHHVTLPAQKVAGHFNKSWQTVSQPPLPIRLHPHTRSPAALHIISSAAPHTASSSYHPSRRILLPYLARLLRHVLVVHLVEQRRAPARRPPRLHVLAVELVDLLEREALDLGDEEPDVAEAGGRGLVGVGG